MDAEEYATRVQRVLSSCEYLAEPNLASLKIQVGPSGGSLFYKCSLDLRDGSLLQLRESMIFSKGNGLVSKEYRYSLRNSSNALIFRFDSHGKQMTVEESCHVHITSEEDQREFSTVGNFDVSALMHCIKNHYSEKKQEWEV